MTRHPGPHPKPHPAPKRKLPSTELGNSQQITLPKGANIHAPPGISTLSAQMAGGYLMENICNDVKAGLAYGDISVLCPQKRQTQQFFDCLTRHKIPAYWLVKDAASKKDYDASLDRVLISTVHSAKGLEFEKVYFSKRQPDGDLLPHKGNRAKILRRLTRHALDGLVCYTVLR